MLSNILIDLALKMGADPIEDRVMLLRYINTAAKELYSSDDFPGCLREIILKVFPDKQIALPYYVGKLRSMREFYSYDKLELLSMRPRYNYNPWPQVWKNWRLKGPSAIYRDITNAGIVTATIPGVDTLEFNVTFNGSTVESNAIADNLLFLVDDVTHNSTKSFTSFNSITKDAKTTYDISILDMDGIEIAVIPNDRLESRYVIVDISALPLSGESPTGEKFVEVLYKASATNFINDSDVFPCEGFDDAIVYKALEFWTSEQPGMEKRALLQFQKTNQVVGDEIRDTDGPLQKEIMFASNPYYEVSKLYLPSIARLR